MNIQKLVFVCTLNSTSFRVRLEGRVIDWDSLPRRKEALSPISPTNKPQKSSMWRLLINYTVLAVFCARPCEICRCDKPRAFAPLQGKAKHTLCSQTPWESGREREAITRPQRPGANLSLFISLGRSAATLVLIESAVKYRWTQEASRLFLPFPLLHPPPRLSSLFILLSLYLPLPVRSDWALSLSHCVHLRSAHLPLTSSV